MSTRHPNIGRGHQLIARYGSAAAALKATHPDRGGDRDDFDDVQAARAALRRPWRSTATCTTDHAREGHAPAAASPPPRPGAASSTAAPAAPSASGGMPSFASMATAPFSGAWGCCKYMLVMIVVWSSFASLLLAPVALIVMWIYCNVDKRRAAPTADVALPERYIDGAIGHSVCRDCHAAVTHGFQPATICWNCGYNNDTRGMATWPARPVPQAWVRTPRELRRRRAVARGIWVPGVTIAVGFILMYPFLIAMMILDPAQSGSAAVEPTPPWLLAYVLTVCGSVGLIVRRATRTTRRSASGTPATQA